MNIDRLHQLREEKGLTRVQVAKEFAVSPSTYGKWELGKRKPDSDTMIKLAELYQVSVDYLLGTTDNPMPASEKKEVSIRDEDIKFALWGEAKDEITEEEMEDVRAYARFVAERKKRTGG